MGCPTGSDPLSRRTLLHDMEALVHSTTRPVDNSGDKLGETPRNVCTQPVENCGNSVNYTG